MPVNHVIMTSSLSPSSSWHVTTMAHNGHVITRHDMWPPWRTVVMWPSRVMMWMPAVKSWCVHDDMLKAQPWMRDVSDVKADKWCRRSQLVCWCANDTHTNTWRWMLNKKNEHLTTSHTTLTDIFTKRWETTLQSWNTSTMETALWRWKPHFENGKLQRWKPYC